MGPFFSQNSAFNFEAVWGQYGLKSFILGQSLSKITIQLHFSPWDHEPMDLVLFKKQGFHRKFYWSDFLMSDTRFYHKMCLKSQKQSQTLCLIEGRTLWTTHVIYNSYSCYFCYEVAVMISLLFFLIYCYQMKFPDKLRLNLSWFFLYTSYTCHNRQSKYQDLTWTTL